MLNDRLYNALQAIFGEVKVANYGENADIIPDPTSLAGWRVPNRGEYGVRGEQYHVCCPFCTDNRYRLYISYLSYARPVVNGVELPPGHMRAYCQNEHCTDKRENEYELEARVERAMAGEVVSIAVNQTTAQDELDNRYSDTLDIDGIRTWCEDYQPIGRSTPDDVLEYIVGRGIDNGTCDWMHIGYGKIYSMSRGYLLNGNPWIMFPIVQNGKLAGLQARAIDKYLGEEKMKYWIHPACRKATLLYNVDNARKLGCGVVCEGVFDVAHIGRAGVCTFGHTPSTIQRTLITSIGNCLIWLPDRDKNNQCDPVQIATEMCRTWNDNNVFALGAHVVLLDGKDAGEKTRMEIWRTILDQVPETVAQYLIDRVVDNL